ncbi:ligase-associated DNA damage response DEXH box helicase [Flavihumibacter petaseus]|uniref:Putative ATP-dependent helicase n=1 Tax=Flavihumibacter petaseus NBRC 106054 TaxID=1220578 RepID=A0A0E9MUJ6_9BACT|nr:ligase-associated DNA damage response DEXH box helicase [Flavihumibacter petaseus]GAO41249.1 putative ATP-dependent helicase [Flavihumibacter petaseus NBRC 106054]
MKGSPGYDTIIEWLTAKDFRPFGFQEEAWTAIAQGESGLVNAPTGYGKTYSVFLGSVIRYINEHPGDFRSRRPDALQLLWVTPLRALAKDIARAMEEALQELGIPWKVGIRNGDTTPAERQRQRNRLPEILIITPESLHLLLAQKDYPRNLRSVNLVAIDEWHELLGSKRGVQVELALSRIVALRPDTPPAIFGISATVGNLEQAMEVLLFPLGGKGSIIRATLPKKMEILSVYPDEIEKYPWAGHLGIKLVDKIIPIIRESRTTLVFINTRGMTERWYQAILDAAPDLAGAIAIHHGSIEQELRIWVEEALHAGTLKVVVCTASLDLGVDFRPVETVIQVGSPKGVARFLQRAGRSGHQPGATSRIWFLPTHSLELVEAAALQEAIQENLIESRPPQMRCFDVLLQYCCTLAVSEGFDPDSLFHEVRSTHCYQDLSEDEWQWLTAFLHKGGKALQQYDDYNKLEWIDDRFRITSRRMAMRHRLHIGTIVSDAMLKVRFVTGGYIGIIEEYFISRLEPGDVFTLAGKNLELVMIKDMTVLVRKSNSRKSIVPSWNGGRMPLSANLGKMLRRQFNEAGALNSNSKRELRVLEPLFSLQSELSHVPRADELLIEQIETRDGFHLFVFPFEGRLVHEAMAAILAWRISKIRPITFSFAMNDYGFELLSDQPIPVDDTNVYALFSPEDLYLDIQRSVNSTEMARRKFRDIAVIGGLIFQGMPGEHKKARHLQASASLLFNVFREYDPDNLLLRQAYQEVFDQQMEEVRLRDMLERIQQSRIVLTFPDRLTPFCFPVKVDSLREELSSEKLEDRIRKMQLQLAR